MTEPESPELPEQDRSDLLRLISTALRGMPDEDVRLPEETILAYLQGTDTEEQRRQVVDALARSASLRRCLVALASDLEALGSAEFAESFATATVDAPPTSRSKFIRQARIRGWFPWLFRRKHSALFWSVQFATVVLVALLAVPAYRGIVEVRRVEAAHAELRTTSEATKRDLESQLANERNRTQGLEREIDALRNRGEDTAEARDTLIASVGASSELLFPDFPGVVRSAPAKPVIPKVRPTRRSEVYVIAVAPELPESVPAHATLVLELLDARGVLKAKKALNAADLRSSLDVDRGSGMEVLTVRTAAVPPGKYVVRLVHAPPSGSKPIWVGEFDLLPPP